MKLYAIRLGGNNVNAASGQWGLCRNKRQAICAAKRAGYTAEVWARNDVPEVAAWDWPTFRIGATKIYPVGP